MRPGYKLSGSMPRVLFGKNPVTSLYLLADKLVEKVFRQEPVTSLAVFTAFRIFRQVTGYKLKGVPVTSLTGYKLKSVPVTSLLSL